ncbi:glycosyltransferase family 4 protein [Psychromonas ossibalaenae]|uniref:glycosyltransferase family 4 protein n=1 Tax=Psychromonas ossibalaenae TaxID=444922 RepID=UPI000374EEC1|nr:glycosyltransferase family 4 protein [Psychromonas ossibalaenae]
MTDKRHLIVIDPTAFCGGSKTATESILRQLDKKQIRITVLTADKHSWKYSALKRVRLYEPKWLTEKEQGLSYFFRHALIALNLLITRLRFGRFDIALGASGPGVDLALYLLRPLLTMKIIQLIHGPVARSRTIARCLNAADQVHYLSSSHASLLQALSTISPAQTEIPAHFYLLHNGLCDQQWPTPCQSQYPVIFWAASLLKWKGLETLLNALIQIEPEMRPLTHICYIKPQGTQLPVSQAPVAIQQVDWYENPVNIDQLRASANIFVSTSKNEPFGLSILEAMAAAHCIVIPADGAYWDRTLKNNSDCIKYQADDPEDLKDKLLMISRNMRQVIELGRRAAEIAQDYRAEKQYANIKNSIEQIDTQLDKKSLVRRSRL